MQCLPEDLFIDGGRTGGESDPSSLDLLLTPAEPHMGSHCLPQIVCLVLAWWKLLLRADTGVSRAFCILTGMLGEAQGRVFSLKLAEAIFLAQVSALGFGSTFCKPSLISLCFSPTPLE